VERNAVRAGLVRRAEAWRWGSLWHRQQAAKPDKGILSDWPLAVPEHWAKEVNRAQTEAELEAVRRSVQRGQPYGDEGWAQRVAVRLGLESTFRARGRPPKQAKPAESANKGS
jgi:putative transposase